MGVGPLQPLVGSTAEAASGAQPQLGGLLANECTNGITCGSTTNWLGLGLAALTSLHALALLALHSWRAIRAHRHRHAQHSPMQPLMTRKH